MKTFEQIKEEVALKYVKCESQYTAFEVLERDYTSKSLSKIYEDVCEIYHKQETKNLKKEIIESLELIKQNWYAKNFIHETVCKLINKLKN